ncbi:Tripeptidyl-peptidase I [Purpureocillium takamizusanense]|uniref:Tripeptidyl-peptidase I n=1 Tax=Purpureocillium takamizusanense TaxID=2060973 RepID=A0A9Q8QAI8_9HYPO|nr:Tripeptidyl-peptidase I [Purpureocillium takamizusanense]UNI15307.1 Tripeptidyl-peptidase I [Purpureocillium takamizusanense]
MMRNLVLLSALSACVLSAPASYGPHVLHQKRSEEWHYDAWVKREAADPTTKVPVSIALKQRNLERGMDLLMEVSDPTHGSGKYGQWYTREQIMDLFAPSDDSVAAVKDWLVRSGVAKSSIVVPKTKGWVHFDSTVGQLESLTQADYHIYSHVSTRDEDHIGTEEYSLPKAVQEHVDFIVPGTAFGRLGSGKGLHRRKSSRGPGGSPIEMPMPPEIEMTNPGDCSRKITPECLRAMYKIPMGKTAHPNNRLGIFESEGQLYGQTDMNRFLETLAPYVPQNFTPDI